MVEVVVEWQRLSKWRWFTCEPYLVLKKSRTCSRTSLRNYRSLVLIDIQQSTIGIFSIYILLPITCYFDQLPYHICTWADTKPSLESNIRNKYTTTRVTKRHSRMDGDSSQILLMFYFDFVFWSWWWWRLLLAVIVMVVEVVVVVVVVLLSFLRYCWYETSLPTQPLSCHQDYSRTNVVRIGNENVS